MQIYLFRQILQYLQQIKLMVSISALGRKKFLSFFLKCFNKELT